MYRVLLKSKVQRLVVTDKNLLYEGSLALDAGLLRAADILPGEMVQVVNVNNGQRFETYAIPGRAGSGECVLNGAAARLGEKGDLVIVMSTALLPERAARRHKPLKVEVDHHNHIVSDSDCPRRR